MKNRLIRKGLVFGIIVLFVGASVTLSISGNNGEDSHTDDDTTIVTTIDYSRPDNTLPFVEIIIPEEGCWYVDDVLIEQGMPDTRIWGKITIEVVAYGGIEIDLVEFYIDNCLKYTDRNAPWHWLWDDESPEGTHEIKVVAYDSVGDCALDSIMVIKTMEPDLSITYVRPVQVRYLDEINYHHPFIAGKRTVARVYVHSTFAVPKLVDFKISGDIDDTEYLHKVRIEPNADTWVIVPGGPRQGDLDTWTNKWFYLSKGDNKEITVEMDYNNRIPEGNENNNEYTVNDIDVQESRSLGVGYVRLKSTWPDDFPTPDKSEFITHASESDDLMDCTYPLEYGKLKSYYKTDPVASTGWSIWPDYYKDLLKLEKINWVGVGVDRTVGIVTEEYWEDQDYNDSPAGLTSTDVTSSLVEIGYWTAAAHEIHHNLPPGDDWRTGAPGCKGGDEEYNRPNEEFPSEGFRMCEREVIEYPYYRNHCFMGYAPYNKYTLSDKLICKECYEHLLKNLEKGDPILYLSSRNEKAIFVSGLIHINDTGVLNDLYVMDNKTLNYPNSTDGNYSIELFNSSGQVIFNLSFEPVFKAIEVPKGNTLSRNETEVNSTIFAFSLPFPDLGSDSFYKVQLKHNDTVLAERIISASSPLVEVLSPNDGEVFDVGENCTIQWQANDNDKDELTYCVLYSTDNGENWTAITVDLNQTEYIWDTSYYAPSDAYKIKIVANDGFNTATDESNETFSLIGNIAPAITDVYATPLFQVNNYPVNISCKITDDDALSMVNVNISGPVGFNITNVSMLLGNNDTYYYNNTYFIPGGYYYTIQAVDSQGETVSAAGRFMVYQSLVANFSYTPTIITTYDTIQFHDLSYDPDGIIVNWTWNFGDRNISYLQNPTHQYIFAGNYTVNLTVIDDDGETDSYCDQVTIGSSVSPVIFNEYPEIDSINVERPPTELNVTIYDPNGDTMDVYIRWRRHDYYQVGEWITLETYIGVGNGTYNYIPPEENDWIWGFTTYVWSVNVTDGISWTNETYQYTTSGSRYDVNNDDNVNFQDAGLVWVHRTSEVEYDGIYDVNQDGQVNFQDAGLTWINRD